MDTLKPGPAPTGRDKIFDALYGALGGKPANRWAADKLTSAIDFGTLGMLTGAYDGGRELAETGRPGALAMALMPGAKVARPAVEAAETATRQGIRAYRGIDQGRPRHGSSESMWASSNPRVADAYANEAYEFNKGAVMPVDMKFSNPMTVDAKGNHWTNIEHNGDTVSTEDLARIARQNGHDGLIIDNVIDTNSKREFQSPATSYAALNRGTTYSPLTKELLYTPSVPLIGGATAAATASSDGEFNESLIEILRKYGLLPPAAGAGLAAALQSDPAQATP